MLLEPCLFTFLGGGGWISLSRLISLVKGNVFVLLVLSTSFTLTLWVRETPKACSCEAFSLLFFFEKDTRRNAWAILFIGGQTGMVGRAPDRHVITVCPSHPHWFCVGTPHQPVSIAFSALRILGREGGIPFCSSPIYSFEPGKSATNKQEIMKRVKGKIMSELSRIFRLSP